MAYELSDSITVAASPSEVFNLVSDITRTGEWSAQCYRAEWEGSALSGEIGSRFTGCNRTPDREWSTVSEVVSSEPGVEFVWKVTSSGTIWGFKMEPVNRRDDATVLTEFTEFTADGESFFQEKFGEDAETQEFVRREAAVAGITETLHAIRMLLES